MKPCRGTCTASGSQARGGRGRGTCQSYDLGLTASRAWSCRQVLMHPFQPGRPQLTPPPAEKNVSTPGDNSKPWSRRQVVGPPARDPSPRVYIYPYIGGGTRLPRRPRPGPGSAVRGRAVGDTVRSRRCPEAAGGECWHTATAPAFADAANTYWRSFGRHPGPGQAPCAHGWRLPVTVCRPRVWTPASGKATFYLNFPWVVPGGSMGAYTTLRPDAVEGPAPARGPSCRLLRYGTRSRGGRGPDRRSEAVVGGGRQAALRTQSARLGKRRRAGQPVKTRGRGPARGEWSGRNFWSGQK